MDLDIDSTDFSWCHFLEVECLGNLENIEVDVVPKSENTKLSPEDMNFYKYCPKWEELNLVMCRWCKKVLLPQALKDHVERRHENKPVLNVSTTKPPQECYIDVGRPVSPAVVKSSSSSPIASDWPYTKTNSHGAFLHSVLNMSMPKVKSRTKLLQPSDLSKRKNLLGKRELPHSDDSPSSSWMMSDCSFDSDTTYISTVLQSDQPSSTSAEKLTPDYTEDSEQRGKKPTLEKLVLRRVLQTDPKWPAIGDHSGQGTKGMTGSKKDSSRDTYFMVVKDKDRQQNLIAARKQIRKQSNVVHQEKDKVEKKMKQLESVREKLINQLFQELQKVKQKLHQCTLVKAELQKELLAVRVQVEETHKNATYQTESLSQQNTDYKSEISELKERLTGSCSSGYLQPNYLYGANQAWNLSVDTLSKQLKASEEQKLLFQKRVEELECELREFKNTANIEKERVDIQLKKYCQFITELKRRLDAEMSQSEELRIQKNFYEKYLPTKLCFQVKSQLTSLPQQTEIFEIFPGLANAQATIPQPAVPFSEKLLTDIQNLSYRAYQQQIPAERTEVFQQQPRAKLPDEDVS